MLSKLNHTKLHHLPHDKRSRSSPSRSRSSPRTVSFPFPFLSPIHIAHFSVRSPKFLSPIHPHFSVRSTLSSLHFSIRSTLSVHFSVRSTQLRSTHQKYRENKSRPTLKPINNPTSDLPSWIRYIYIYIYLFICLFI